MMLSGTDIRNAITTGDIAITPYDELALRPAGVVLHLGAQLLRPVPGQVVDVKSGRPPSYDSIEITDEHPYRLESGEFILGHTFESVTVGDKYGLLIEGRSTLARVGLTIVQTAMLVYPGHRDRPITLEFANHGPNPILLYPHMKIARASFFELKTPSEKPYDDHGKYRDQRTVGAPIFKEEMRKRS